MRRLMIGLGLAIATMIVHLPVAGAPKIEFEKAALDLGDVPEGCSLQAAYTFKNTGDQDLEIRSIEVSCSCTISKCEKSRIPPGQSSKIAIGFTPSGPGGLFEKSLIVVTNDPSNQASMLTFSGKIVPVGTPIPEWLDFGTIKAGSKHEMDLIITPTRAAKFKITKTESRTGHVSAVVVGNVQDERTGYRLKVCVNAGDAAGQILDRLVVHTDLPGDPIIGVLVFGNVEK